MRVLSFEYVPRGFEEVKIRTEKLTTPSRSRFCSRRMAEVKPGALF
jgi:hypothetical protein